MCDHFEKEKCRLCGVEGSYFRPGYLICPNCSGIFMAGSELLSHSREKARYDTHNNDVNDPGYQKFVSPIVTAVKEKCSHSDKGLDFGAGPGPVISSLLGSAGYSLKQYDPYYFNDPQLLEVKYDYIICCEVIEHFNNPFKSFKLLRSLLKPSGKIFVMTLLYSQDIDFDTWFYRNDETHVFFYQKPTLEWVKQKFAFSSLEIEKRLVTFVG